MESALKFLDLHRDIALATVEEGRPKIRVFQIMRMEGETLYFATSPHKEVYRQLQADPHVEIMAMSGNIFVRIAGEVRFDVEDERARAIYSESAVLCRLYADYTELVYFSLPIATLDYYDLTPTPPLQEHFERE